MATSINSIRYMIKNREVIERRKREVAKKAGIAQSVQLQNGRDARQFVIKNRENLMDKLYRFIEYGLDSDKLDNFGMLCLLQRIVGLEVGTEDEEIITSMQALTRALSISTSEYDKEIKD